MESKPACRKCGSDDTRIETKSGQDVVRCNSCLRWSHNAPKTETGRAQRTVTTTHNGIKPAQRYRIIERDGGRCKLCGKSQGMTTAGLHVDHVISVIDGHKHGLSDRQLNDDENLLTLCDECNLGKSSSTMPLWLLVNVLMIRTKNQSALLGQTCSANGAESELFDEFHEAEG